MTRAADRHADAAGKIKTMLGQLARHGIDGSILYVPPAWLRDYGFGSAAEASSVLGIEVRMAASAKVMNRNREDWA